MSTQSTLAKRLLYIFYSCPGLCFSGIEVFFLCITERKFVWIFWRAPFSPQKAYIINRKSRFYRILCVCACVLCSPSIGRGGHICQFHVCSKKWWKIEIKETNPKKTKIVVRIECVHEMYFFHIPYIRPYIKPYIYIYRYVAKRKRDQIL